MNINKGHNKQINNFKKKFILPIRFLSAIKVITAVKNKLT